MANSYIIPKLTRMAGMTPSLAIQELMLSTMVSLCHTIEIPENEESSTKQVVQCRLGELTSQPRSGLLPWDASQLTCSGLNKNRRSKKLKMNWLAQMGNVDRVKMVVQNSSRPHVSSQWASTKTTMPKKPSIWLTTSNAMVSSCHENSKKILVP